MSLYNKIEEHEIFHMAQVDKIKHRPGLVDITGVALSTGETILFNPKGLIMREPDNLIFDPTTHTLYNIEYKTRNTKSAYQKAKLQLRTSGKHLERIFEEWSIVNLYISGDFDVRELKR